MKICPKWKRGRESDSGRRRKGPPRRLKLFQNKEIFFTKKNEFHLKDDIAKDSGGAARFCRR
jgi:hypothetical protein